MRLSTELESPVSVQPRVLILDDEFAQRAGICLQLSSVGYFDFIEFDDPRPALEYLRHQSVDLVIVDVRMPHLPVDGLWFMEQFPPSTSSPASSSAPLTTTSRSPTPPWKRVPSGAC